MIHKREYQKTVSDLRRLLNQNMASAGQFYESRYRRGPSDRRAIINNEYNGTLFTIQETPKVIRIRDDSKYTQIVRDIVERTKPDYGIIVTPNINGQRRRLGLHSGSGVIARRIVNEVLSDKLGVPRDKLRDNWIEKGCTF